jgi:peptide deformylase
MAMLKIVKYPDPILSLVAKKVEFPLSNEVKTLIRDMWETVDGIGVGLAAPQVGHSLQMCIIGLDPDRIPKKQKIKNNFVMIDPVITFQSEVQSNMIEGCLSFPDEFWQIKRSSNIIVEFYNEKGKKEIIKASSWLARVILHEVDHLQGNLYINLGGQKLKQEDFDENDIVD